MGGMSFEATALLALLGAMVVLLAIDKIRADIVAMLGLVSILALDLVLRVFADREWVLLKPGEILEGFSNPATIAVASMFVLSAGLQGSGVVRVLGDRVLRDGPSGWLTLLILTAVVIGPISAFINNTAAVAVFLPIALRACHGNGISPSRILMPLSFFAMLGGTCTLIGTSTNILVASYASTHDIEPFGMFEFSSLGLVLFGIGGIYLVGAGRLVPDRVPPESLTEGYHLNRYLSEVVILEDSPLIGQTLREARLGERHDLEVLGLYRDKQMLGLPGDDTRLESDDVLIVKAPAAALVQLRETMGLVTKHGRHPDDADLRSVDSALIEVVVAPNSRLEGQTLKSIDFRHRYGATALAIRRHGEDMRDKIGRVRLQVGDELLTLAPRRSLERLRSQSDFVVLQEIDVPVLRPLHAAAALLIVAGVVGFAAAGIVPIAESALCGSVLMVVTRCVVARRVYEAVDWRIVIMLACLIPFGTALERSGAADDAVRALLGVAESWGPTAVLAAIYMLTSLLTGILSNTATAVLLTPLAISTASALGVDPRPFLVAVTFAASSAFYTPIGYQTNLLVYGPGGYRFLDFVRVGGPLNLVLWIAATLLIPRFFPF